MLWGLFRVAYWCVVVACLLIGARLAAGDPNKPWQEVIVPWLQFIGLPLLLFATAAIMTTIPLTKWFLDRRHARDLQRQIRQNLTPGSFRETHAAEALRYLLHESAWGWKTYARLNYWTMVDGMHFGEFERAALAGEIAVFGFGSREGKVAPIERRMWKALRLDPETLEARMTRSAVYLEKPTYSELAVPTMELELVWPKASAVRRWCSWLWVTLKIKIWYGSKLNNWLDARRRRSKPDRTFS
jgi:hypothetical protein